VTFFRFSEQDQDRTGWEEMTEWQVLLVNAT